MAALLVRPDGHEHSPAMAKQLVRISACCSTASSVQVSAVQAGWRRNVALTLHQALQRSWVWLMAYEEAALPSCLPVNIIIILYARVWWSIVLVRPLQSRCTSALCPTPDGVLRLTCLTLLDCADHGAPAGPCAQAFAGVPPRAQRNARAGPHPAGHPQQHSAGEEVVLTADAVGWLDSSCLQGLRRRSRQQQRLAPSRNRAGLSVCRTLELSRTLRHSLQQL